MPGSANNVELFNVIKDPNETTNLVRSYCCMKFPPTIDEIEIHR